MNYVVIEKARPYTRTRRGKLERVKGYAGRPRKAPEFEYGDFIVLKPDAEVSLSYGEGSPPKKYVKDKGLWAVDGYEEESGMLNINRVLNPYPGAYCAWVHKDDVVKVSSAKERKRKEEMRKKAEEVKEESSVVIEKLKANPSLAEYIVKRPQSHSPELVETAKKVLGKEIHGRTY